MSDVRIEPAAERSLKKLRRSDPGAARRIQPLIDQILAGETPQRSARMTTGQKVRKQLGVLPWKVADGKLRMIFVPGESIIAVGYRREVYEFLGSGWSN